LFHGKPQDSKHSVGQKKIFQNIVFYNNKKLYTVLCKINAPLKIKEAENISSKQWPPLHGGKPSGIFHGNFLEKLLFDIHAGRCEKRNSK